jgi:hypothetical protein
MIDYKKYLDLSARERREILRDFAKDPEISDCVDTLADEIFSRARFSSTITWSSVRKYLVDGLLAFEKIGHPEKAPTSFIAPISYKELDPLTLFPSYVENQHMWIQYPDDSKMKRALFPDQVVAFSYSTNNSSTSYVESLIRPFNHMKLAEDSLISNIFGKVPGVPNENLIEQENVNYFRDKFYIASRIPENFRGFSEEVRSSGDRRWDLFVEKHVNYLRTLSIIQP